MYIPHVAFVVNKVALGQIFSKYFGFLLSVSFHRLHVPHRLHRVIRKSLWDFRPLWYSSLDGHAEGHVNRGRDTPTFCPTLQVLDMSNLRDAADVNTAIKFMPTGT